MCIRDSSLDTDHVSADIEVKKEVILKNDNNVWTMSVTSKENDNGEITNTTETISGSEEEVMSALREYNLNEVEKLAASAMAKIDK